MRVHGPANFLYSDGEFLYAHGHRRTQSGGHIAPPGLWVLQRRCAVDRDALPQAGISLESGAGPQSLVLIASVPLTGEGWRPLAEGELLVAGAGDIVSG
jgi:glutamine amidotransferase